MGAAMCAGDSVGMAVCGGDSVDVPAVGDACISSCSALYVDVRQGLFLSGVLDFHPPYCTTGIKR